MSVYDDMLRYQDWYEELRQAIADYDRGVITREELLDIAGVRR